MNDTSFPATVKSRAPSVLDTALAARQTQRFAQGRGHESELTCGARIEESVGGRGRVRAALDDTPRSRSMLQGLGEVPSPHPTEYSRGFDIPVWLRPGRGLSWSGYRFVDGGGQR